MQNDDYREDQLPEEDSIPDDRDAPPERGRGGYDREERDTDRAGARPSGQSGARQGASRSGGSGGKKNTNTKSGGKSGGKSSSGGKKGKKERIDLKASPSARPVHRIVPCLMLAFAIFLFVCMFLNLVSGENSASPSTHPIGAVGYGVCYAFFGLFGGGAFLLPFLLGYLALNWRTLVDRHRLIERSVVSFGLQLFLSVFIHCCNLGVMDKAERYMTAGELLAFGARMTGGGLFGGGVGYFLCTRMNVFGAIFLTVLLLLAGIFIFIGMTPQHLYARIRARIVIARAKKKKDDADEMESAPIMERMGRKHDRAAGRRTDDEDEPTAPPPGAVTYPNGRTNSSRAVVRGGTTILNDEDSPVPVMPILDATDDVRSNSGLFVPQDIGERLDRKEEKTTKTAGETVEKTADEPSEKPIGQTDKAQPAREIARTETVAARTVRAPMQPDPQTAALRQAESAAVDQIFPPQPSEQRNAARRVQKSDRGFELGSIFIDGPDAEIPKERTHVPLPPEVPLPGTVRRAQTAETAVPTEAGQSAQNAQSAVGAAVRPTAGKPGVRVGATPQRPVGGAARPAPSGAARPTPVGHEPTLRQAAAKGVQDFGMSGEELDAKENAALTIDRAIAAKKARTNGALTKPKPVPVPVPPPADREYVFPPISYLQAGEPITEQTREELEQNARRIAEKLKTFHVDTEEITYSCGPTVTRYEVVPATNVRVRTVLNMDKDIALTFGVKDVRMDSIEGKSAIGIEVPNKNRSTVYLRNMIEAQEFTDSKKPLFCCLGSDVAGSPIYFSIPKMPHLLVAGATNSGKSVCINCIVMSILYKWRPDQVKLVMIDPKKVEFVPYQGLPHLLAPVITTPKDASGALQAAVNEMESRFDRIADVGVRNIDAYNELAEKDAGLIPMSRVVIIIDELADLMMVAKNEVEDSICRLLQKARAAGIYLIIGTQRPSVDVITGLLKANIPSRISCTVSSVVDSRTVLDRGGAEKLLGMGDMLFSPTGSRAPIRVQGAYLSDAEVEKICDFVRATNGRAQYDESFTKLMKEYSAQSGKKGKEDGDTAEALTDGDTREDSKYEEAVRVAVEMGKISTSMLQRKIGVGYARGAKLLDRMESEGIVTKQDGAKPRDVLMSAEQFTARFIDGNDEE